MMAEEDVAYEGIEVSFKKYERDNEVEGVVEAVCTSEGDVVKEGDTVGLILDSKNSFHAEAEAGDQDNTDLGSTSETAGELISDDVQTHDIKKRSISKRKIIPAVVLAAIVAVVAVVGSKSRRTTNNVSAADNFENYVASFDNVDCISEEEAMAIQLTMVPTFAPVETAYTPFKGPHAQASLSLFDDDDSNLAQSSLSLVNDELVQSSLLLIDDESTEEDAFFPLFDDELANFNGNDGPVRRKLRRRRASAIRNAQIMKPICEDLNAAASTSSASKSGKSSKPTGKGGKGGTGPTCPNNVTQSFRYEQTGTFVSSYSNSNDVTDQTTQENVPVRTVLDDFEVPKGEIWSIETFSWQHVWRTSDTTSSPSGTGVNVSIRLDNKGSPGNSFANAVISGGYYLENDTGEIYKSQRKIRKSTATFDPSFDLQPGVYWFEARIIGPDNNFWLAFENLDDKEPQGWLNYPEYPSGLSAISDAEDENGVNFEYPSTHSFNFVLEGMTEICSP